MLRRPPTNVERLESCKAPHNFQAYTGNPYRWHCIKCGGKVSEGEAVWYAMGVTHGRGEVHSK